MRAIIGNGWRNRVRSMGNGSALQGRRAGLSNAGNGLG
jgi:hypothetical protein